MCQSFFHSTAEKFLAFMSFHHVRFIIVKNFDINSFHSGEKVSLVMSTRKLYSLGANLKSHFHKRKKFLLVHELCCFPLEMCLPFTNYSFKLTSKLSFFESHQFFFGFICGSNVTSSLFQVEKQ